MDQISLPKKITVCFIAGLIASGVTQRIIYRTIWEFKNKWISPPVLIVVPVLIILLLVIAYAVYWHVRERNGQIDSPRILAFWQGVIRYFIAIDLSMIGWQKIFHLQFYTPLGILDQPLSCFSGEALTWAYFGHSYAFTCVVGLLQIAGSYLLLFKRTKLFGSFILFPVLLNIVLIDFFYGLDLGELGHAIILMIGIVYLLLQEYDRLIEFFFLAKSNLPVINFKSRLIQNSIKLSATLIPVILILSYGSPDKNPQLTGKYSVTNLLINGKQMTANSCQDSVLTVVYFDKGDDIVFEFNSQQRRLLGSYNFNSSNKIIKASWRYPLTMKNPLVATLTNSGNNNLTISGTMGNEKLEATLIKN